MKIETIEWNGKPISKPGLYSKIPMHLYHSTKICSGPSISSSGLRRIFNESPAHFYDTWPGNPNYEGDSDKPHFVLGRAVHHLMLGEPFFAKLFAVQPMEYPDSKTGEMKPWNNNSNFAKSWAEAQAKAGKAILKSSDVAKIRGMADRLSRNAIVKAGALNGLIERSIFWEDEETGIWLKSRPDSIPNDSGDFVDLKTTASVQWNDLQRTVADYGYHQQGALIREAARKVLKFQQPTFTLVFIESDRPHCDRVVTLKDNDLDRGEKQNRAALDTFARCLKSGQWPGPGGDRDDAVGIELPEWAQKQIDSKLEYGV